MRLKNLSYRFSKVLIVIILLIFLVSNNSCKKDRFVSSQNISEFKNEFQEKLYNELLAYDKSHHLLDSINPSERLDWKKMILRVSSSLSQPINYELPIVKSDETCNSFLEFSFSKDKKLVNIKIRKFDPNLGRLQKQVTSLSENDRTGNILYFLGKKDLKISAGLAEAKDGKITYLSEPGNLLETSIRNSNASKASQRLMNFTPSGSRELSYTPKPPNPDVITCATIIEYDFYFDFGKEVPNAESLLIAETLRYFFFDNLNARQMAYDINVQQNNVIFFLNNNSDVETLIEVIKYCALYAVESTKAYEDLQDGYFTDFTSSASSTCVAYTPVEPETIISVFPDNPCATALVSQLDDLTTNTVSSALKNVFGDQSNIDLIFEVGSQLQGSNVDGRFYQKTDYAYRIYINPDVLKNSSQEYMIATFYHEAIHAYLAERLKTLGEQQYAIQYGEWGLYNDRLLGVQDEQHASMGRAIFVNAIRDAIMSFNPNFGMNRATALAQSGILTSNSSTSSINSQERDTRYPGYTGTKCP